MQENSKNNEKSLSQEIINLVVARLKTIPSNANLSVGNGKEPMPVDQLIEEVKKQSDVGKKIVESQLYFLRSLQNLPVA
ncbi:hypothetical protein KGQ27_03375 [Patescibacteria group bacterium]|nr:hypothetical protein [Patescibacteria group bacterium]MDE1946699.1 hypothetical protein [Patescibacteria group bacterium]MDE2010998.1 hypothetical protein [Patescibacteria group bacterium]MDE2232840.1 hypothetical protein [Patescibacteria group bacterium]